MYWREGRDKEIEALKSAIIKTAFKKGKIVVYKQPSIRFDETKISIDSFVYEIADKIWKHQQHMRDDEMKDLLSEARKETKRRLEDIEKSLTQRFSKTAIKKVMKILVADSERQFEPKNYSEDVKEYHSFNPRAQAWIKREDSLIGDIRDLYIKNSLFEIKKGKEIHHNNYQIAYSIALIFEASKLWPDTKNHFEKMRKRFQEIDRQKKPSQQQTQSPPEIPHSIPQYFLN